MKVDEPTYCEICKEPDNPTWWESGKMHPIEFDHLELNEYAIICPECIRHILCEEFTEFRGELHCGSTVECYPAGKEGTNEPH